MDVEVRKRWSTLRYDYYSAGRNEFLIGNNRAAGIVLGYAVECSLKHTLREHGFDNGEILYSHEVDLLFEKCKEIGALSEVKVSDEFLDYINDHLKPRYPSLMEKVQQGIEKEGRVDIIGPLLLSWYDDFLYQIDECLYELTGDNLSSCFFRGAADVDQLRGCMFFHGNYHACKSIDDLIDRLKEHGANDRKVELLKEDRLDLWSNITGVPPAEPWEDVNYTERFCQRFHYPKWEKEEGKPKIEFKDWSHLKINKLPWE